MALDADALREAAAHRGLKLIKSRKRTPGVGDYGRFGLADTAGKPLFGVGDDGLTASAQDIADFLRKGEAATWASSAEVTPARAKRAEPEPSERADREAPPVRARATGRRRSPTPSKDPELRRRAPAKMIEHGPEPRPVPTLDIRPARKGDAAAVAALLALQGFERDETAIDAEIAAAARRKEPVLIADRGGVVGCLAWHALPTLQQGPVARITALIVAEADRRAGIGRALYEACRQTLLQRGIATVEAMSDIAVRNANGFYRAIGLDQKSYRFSQAI